MARTTRPTRPFRPGALALGGLAVAALALSGCSPITTQMVYSPGDGIRATLGDQVEAANLLLLTSGEGDAGLLVGGFTNLTDDQAELTVTVGGESFGLPIGPRETVLLGAPEGVPGPTVVVEEVRIDSVPAPPGAFTDVTLATMEAGELTVGVPVLDGTLEPYDALIP